MTGGDRILAEDMAQETFFRVIRSIHQYRYPRSLKPWVYAIATNIARDYFKRASNRLSVELDTEAEQVEDIQYPEDALLEADEQQRVAAAVRSLPLHQRTAIILRYYQGLSLAEIAETLQIPVGTVKSRLSLGLRTLKNILERE
jgi:RNA polymerase sigma-70 factor (ECF subfamily)